MSNTAPRTLTPAEERTLARHTQLAADAEAMTRPRHLYAPYTGLVEAANVCRRVAGPTSSD